MRPTLDRVRETLFNWLQYEVEGARVLDAFSGSGALGFEALSRGAKEVVFLEKNAKAAMQIRENLATLNARNAQLWAGDALAWLQQNPEPFDLVFLDPPFGQNLLQPAIDSLRLLPGSWVYVEHETGLDLTWPKGWEEHRSKETKEFCFRLWRITGEE